MNDKTVKYSGIILIIIALSIFFSSFGIDIAQSGYSMAFQPTSSSTANKISDSLQHEISRLPPDAKVPIIIELTIPAGTMAISQQQSQTLSFLQSKDFQLKYTTMHVANTISGMVPAGQVEDIAQNNNIKSIDLDKLVRLADSTKMKVNLLDLSIPMIGADKAWAQGYTGQGVTVILIDEGIDNDHPYLMRDGKSLVLKEYHYVGNHDYTGNHGTHIAGIVASQHPTYKGVAPGIKGFIDMVAFYSDGTAYRSTLISALDKAYQIADDYRPCISTNSWGGEADYSSSEDILRRSMLKLAEKCVVLAAAGNYGPGSGTIMSPGDADNQDIDIITVGATADNGNIGAYSSRGPDNWGYDHDEPDIVAPGTSITSLCTGGRLCGMTGTSMATPMVAGTVALMMSKNPQLDHKTAFKILTQTADRYPSFDYAYGYGLVQADKAVSSTPVGLPNPTPVAYISYKEIVATGLGALGVVFISYSNLIVRKIGGLR